MKLTIFGLTLSSSWGNGHATPYRALLKALHRRGHDVVFYEKNTDYYARRRDFTDCDFCSLILYSSWEGIRSHAFQEAAESDAVIVGSYCPDGARIGDDVLSLSAPVRVFYDLDTPITLQNLKSGGVSYLRAEQMPVWDLYLSFTGGGILDELHSRWRVRRARPLFGCVDPDVHAHVAPRPDLTCLLSYMGTYATDRHEKVEQLFLEPALRRADDRFILAGSLYPATSQWPANVQLLEHVAPADHPALYSSSRLTLNVTRSGMARFGYCPSGRFFEAAACGTPLITDWWEGLDTFFGDDELFVAHNADHVLDAIAASDEQLARMANLSRHRTLDEHTGDRRAAQLISYLEECKRPNSRAEAVA